MKLKLFAYLFLFGLIFFIAVPVSAKDFAVTADKFAGHSYLSLDGSSTYDPSIGKMVRVLGDNHKVNVNIGLNKNLKRHVEQFPAFQVCALFSNYERSTKNNVRLVHPTYSATVDHQYKANGYRVLCSDQETLTPSGSKTGGFKVLSGSQGTVKVRAIIFRGIEDPDNTEEPDNTSALEDYEFSRALGYLWGDGRLSDDGYLQFLKRNSKVSNHFGSVANAYFGDELIVKGIRYNLKPNGINTVEFLNNGLDLSDIPDKRAFITSVIETEGAVAVGRLADDPSIKRCNFLRDLVNSINTQCLTNTCTDASCRTPNCAFIAKGNRRGTPYREGVTSHCGVYLSGDSADWRSLFSSDRYHFVKTDRTPGGEPRQNDPDSRPAYTQ